MRHKEVSAGGPLEKVFLLLRNGIREKIALPPISGHHGIETQSLALPLSPWDHERKAKRRAEQSAQSRVCRSRPTHLPAPCYGENKFLIV